MIIAISYPTRARRINVKYNNIVNHVILLVLSEVLLCLSHIQVMRNEECIFREKLTQSFYDNYYSYKYSHRGLALGLMKTGAAVSVSRTTDSHKEYETQFITMITF